MLGVGQGIFFGLLRGSPSLITSPLPQYDGCLGDGSDVRPAPVLLLCTIIMLGEINSVLTLKFFV